MEQPLSAWGAGDQPSNAVRRGDVVLRTAGSWSPTVVALLEHLAEVGFRGAPRVVGTGFAPDGRLTVGFAPGDSPHPRAWPDGAHAQVGALLRAAHDAGSTFEPHDPHWHANPLHDVADDGDLVIGHGDPAPWNIVGPPGSPASLIDWDLAGPVGRLTEVAYAVWLNAQLHDDDVAELHRLPDAATRARHAREVADGYGLTSSQRGRLVDRMVEVALAGVRADAVEHSITPDSVDAVTETGYPLLWSVTWRSRSAAWMLSNRRLLDRALGSQRS